MTILLVRMQEWDDGMGMTFCETRKISGIHWEDNLKTFSQDYLGHQAKGIGSVKTICAIAQTAHRVNLDGTLTYLGRLDTKLPPPRKVKVINNPSKPIANWLSVLEAPVAVEEDEINPDEGDF